MSWDEKRGKYFYSIYLIIIILFFLLVIGSSRVFAAESLTRDQLIAIKESSQFQALTENGYDYYLSLTDQGDIIEFWVVPHI